MLILCALLSITASAYWLNASTRLAAAADTQDNTMLERRISQLEQRFYTIETSINRLDQQVALSQRPTVTQQPGARDTEVTLLRAEVQALQRRLSEIECGLAKLDERTLAPAARRKSGPDSTDPCRLNPEGPLRLSARP